MKAIYINIDPYLAAIKEWLDAGKPGTKPDFQPLPLAVTVPAGASAAVFAQTGTISGAIASVSWAFSPSLGDAVASNVSLSLSGLLASETASVYSVTGSSFTATATITDTQDTPATYAVAFTVLVRRETASGPVDLVDFTPPAAAPSAADIKSALVAAGNGALDGVDLGGARLVYKDAESPEGTKFVMLGNIDGEGSFDVAGPLIIGDDVETAIGIGSNS